MSKKILIVEDERDIANILRISLEQEEYEVVIASTGREALEQVFFARPDLIVLDVMLPEIDGFAVLKSLKANAATAAIPVIMLTAKKEEADVARGWKMGADLYLAKPFEREELVDCIARIFTGDTAALPPGPGARDF